MALILIYIVTNLLKIKSLTSRFNQKTNFNPSRIGKDLEIEL